MKKKNYHLKIEIKIIKKLIVLTIFSTSIANAEMSWTSTLSEHQNAGCPYNSICSKDLGEIFIKYHHALKTGNISNFFEKNGIPITAMRKKEIATDKKEMTGHTPDMEAIWDSPCEYRTNKKSSYNRVMKFAKNFDDNSLTYPFYVLVNEEGLAQKYPTSSDDSVLGFQKNRLIFNRLVEGVYYQYQVTNLGKIEIKPEVKITRFSRKINCPMNLYPQVSKYFQNPNTDALSCREIFAANSDKSYLFYLPRCE